MTTQPSTTPDQPDRSGLGHQLAGEVVTERAVTLVAPWWKGLLSDHVYEECPALRRSEPELKRHGWYGVGRGELDPEGGDVCGWCLRVWRARSTRNTTLS